MKGNCVYLSTDARARKDKYLVLNKKNSKVFYNPKEVA